MDGTNISSTVLAIMNDGMSVYCTPQYTRIRLDHHIQSQRAIDRLASDIVLGRGAIIYLGAADFNPNSPIRIKKHVRYPGVRKLWAAFKRRDNCHVIWVNEFNTSQHCGHCLKPFHRRTKAAKRKQCDDCAPLVKLQLANEIVPQRNKRQIRVVRIRVRDDMERDDQVAANRLTDLQNVVRQITTRNRQLRDLYTAAYQQNTEQQRSTCLRNSFEAITTSTHSFCFFFGLLQSNRWYVLPV